MVLFESISLTSLSLSLKSFVAKFCLCVSQGVVAQVTFSVAQVTFMAKSFCNKVTHAWHQNTSR